MLTMPSRIYSALVFSSLIAVGALATANSRAADVYDAAVEHPGRSAEDIKRDALDHPADVLRLAKIKPGMRVGDVLAADGYYSELLSYIVGPKGHVLLLNNKAYDHWSDGQWQKRLAGNRLPNVEHRAVDLERIDLPDQSLDALLLVKVYHDLYWVDPDPKATWTPLDTSAVLDQLTRVLKPGGILLIVDHSAKAGTGSAAASSLHRIDEAYTRHDFEKRGFELVGKSDVLRRPADRRDQISYKEPMLGKTDRFVLVFRKRARS
jgi:predicted methyltransferase